MNTSNEGTNQPQSEAEVGPTYITAPDGSATALVQVLDQYMADLQAGNNPDREKLLAEHPGLAPQLQECLGGIEFIHQTSHSADDTPSQLGDFRIEREIGRGGMGVVYEAEQISLKRRVALKVLRFGGVADAEAVQRFQREAETVAGLEHANIVPVFAVGTEDGVHYYAMQFIEGQSLADLNAEFGIRNAESTATDVENAASQFRTPHSPFRTATWGLAAAEALSHAHQNGVVHRDVKPSNLILDNDGRLWLTDFGLARRDIDTTLSIAGALLGTPRYMSPEQAAAAKKPVDHRTDIYSLGATLYELSTGKPVFDADTPQGVITQILNADPPAPRNLDPDLPLDLETIILKCLAKEPADRYATAADLAEDLRAFLHERPIRARRPTLVERGVQALRRHRRVASAGGLSAGIAVLLVIGGFLGSQYLAESRMGEVGFSTSGPRMVGEIVNDAGDTVVSDFAVPTIDKLKLPAGEYHVRLSADGMLSETWPLEVTRGQDSSLSVQFRSRWLWPPKELDPQAYTVIDVVGRTSKSVQKNEPSAQTNSEVRPTGAADLLIVSHQKNEELDLYESRVRRIDGRTGKAAWPVDLILRNDTIPEGRESDGWPQLLSYSGVSGRDVRRLVQPAVDLDGDGITDPVFAARGTPSLLALSGVNGSMLWWYRARPTLPGETQPPTDGKWAVSGGTVVGTPLVADANSDGTPDVIACFLSDNDRFHRTSGGSVRIRKESWLEAVSGRTGESLWRMRLDADARDVLYSSNHAQEVHRACRIQTATIDGEPIVVTVIAKQLVGANLKTGAAAWPPHKLEFDRIPTSRSGDGSDSGKALPDSDQSADRSEFRSLRSPVCRDLNGDGNSDVVLFHWRQSEESGLLQAIDLAALKSGDPAESWQRTLRPTERDDDLRDNRGGGEWSLVDDLNGDGSAEIVVATGQFDYPTGFVSASRFGGVEMLHGGTGEVVWTRRLTVTGRNQPPNIDRLVAGPDLNGDGHREVFAAWIGPSSPYSWHWESAIKVVALSGKDGSTLWRWKDTVGRSYQYDRLDYQPLTWWQPGSDGWPLLVVPVARARGGQDMTYFLAASTGRLEHTLSDVREPQVGDFNGDGIVDLFYRVSPQGSPRMLAIAGTPPEPWKRLGSWQPITDVNDDGHDDFLKTYGMTVASGRDGRILWTPPERSHPSVNRKIQLAPPLPFGDVDGDGAGDLFTFRESSYVGGGRSTEPGLSVYSGRDGQLVRSGSGDISLSGSSSGGYYNWHYDYPHMDWTDLDGDNRADILSMTMVKGDSLGRWMLSAWSGKDGSMLWQKHAVRGTIGASPDPYRGIQYVDLNGDGTGDPVMWATFDSVQADAGSIGHGAVADAELADAASVSTKPSSGKKSDDSDPEKPFHLQAVNGTDGRVLWSVPELAIEKARDVLWPRPAVGDLDGDGAHEVVVVMTGRDRRQDGYPSRLIVLSAADGTRRWSYEWTGTFDLLPPLLVDFDGDGSQTVCFGLSENDAYSILLLKPDGTILERIPLDIKNSFANQIPLWTATDADGDGREELLFNRDSELVCSRGGTDAIVWSWPMPEVGHSTLLAQGFRDRPGEVVVWSGDSVYGLDAADGHVRWQCEGNQRPQFHSSHAPGVALLNVGQVSNLPASAETKQVTNLPNVLFHDDSYHQSFATIVQQATALQPDGTLQLPEPAPREYAALGEEPRAKQRLPWMNGREPSFRQHLECLAIPVGLTMLMVMIPVWLIRATLRASSTMMATLLTLMLCGAVAFGTLGPFTQAASNAIAFALPILLLVRWWKRRRAGDIVLAATSLVLLAAPLVVLHRTPHPLAETNAWGDWFWLDELLLERLMVGLVAGLPGFLYWKALINSIQRSDRDKVRRLLVWPSVLAIVFAALVIGLDTRLQADAFNYSWNGWYIIWFWGAFAVGGLVLLGVGIELLAAWRRRRVERQLASGTTV